MKIPLLLLPVLLAVSVRAEEPQDFARSVGDIRAAIEKNETAPTVPGRPVKPAGSSSVKDRVAQAVNGAGWAPEIAYDDKKQVIERAGLSQAAYDAGYRVMSRQNPETGVTEYNIITPPGFLPNNSRSYAGVTGLRALGDYLVWERGGSLIYQNLLKKAVVLTAGGERREDFDLVAQMSNGVLSSVTNPIDERARFLSGTALLAHGLARLGLSPVAIKNIEKSVVNHARGGEYLIHSASVAEVIIGIDGRAMRVFPDRDGATGR